MTRPTSRRRASPRVLLAGLVALAALANARTAIARDERRDETPRVEVSIGFGGAHAAERSLFNLPSDAPSTPDFLVDFRVRQNVDPHFAFGFHGYGTTERTPTFYASDALGNVTSTQNYRLTIFQLGVDARWTPLPPPVQPYVEVGVSYVSGSLENDNHELLRLTGGSFGGGPGVQVAISRHWAAGAQGLFTVGSAKWEKRPFANSTGRDYDPGVAGGEGFVTFRWFH